MPLNNKKAVNLFFDRLCMISGMLAIMLASKWLASKWLASKWQFGTYFCSKFSTIAE
jgi:hypothetical protein